MTLISVVSGARGFLLPAGQEVVRRRRRADAGARRAAERIEAARLLTGIASCQLRLSELDRQAAGRHPDLVGYDDDLRATLSELVQRELVRFQAGRRPKGGAMLTELRETLAGMERDYRLRVEAEVG